MSSTTIVLLLTLASTVGAQITDSLKTKQKPIGSVLRTVRSVEMTKDTFPEILQIETTNAKRFRDIKITFGIYHGSKLLYRYSWKADDYFERKDRISDTIKWLRLQHIMKLFFSDQNFNSSGNEDTTSLFSRVAPVDIQPGSYEANEYGSSSHKIYSIYAGRDMLFAITWLESKKKFVTLWRN